MFSLYRQLHTLSNKSGGNLVVCSNCAQLLRRTIAFQQVREAQRNHKVWTTVTKQSSNHKKYLLHKFPQKKFISISSVTVAVPSQPSSKKKVIKIRDGMTVSELATSLSVSHNLVKKILQNVGQKVQQKNLELPVDILELVVNELGHIPKKVSLSPLRRDERSTTLRPPVVTIMGHVDHGKTTLLDSLRKTSVAAQEAGGITQHIGAFSVTLSSGHTLTFLDTPGHAAFSAMRSRGAHATDIVVLVVAADDGVMEQTKESIRLIRQAGVPVIVAINKCDKHGVNLNRVKQELLQNGIQLEEFGGEVQAVEISALKGKGLDTLEEAVLAQAEMCDIRGDTRGPVEGVVIESNLEKGLGPVATLIVQHGTLKVGDILVAGETWGKIRALFNEHRKPIRQALPSTPVLTVGWKGQPAAGDKCLEAANEREASQVCAQVATSRTEQLSKTTQSHESIEKGGKIFVPVVVKGDVMGSVEAVTEVLMSRQPEEVELKLIHSGVGPITENDVETASAANGLILGFNVSCNKTVSSLSKAKDVTILSHSIIYKLLETLKSHLETLLAPSWKDEIHGEAIILKVFKLTGAKSASVGGCRVKQGRLLRNAKHRLIRDGEVIHEGSLTGMKHGKEDVEMARKETECGVSFTKDPGFQVGDVVQCFEKKRVPQKLKWDLGFQVESK